MARSSNGDVRERLASAGGVALFHALLGYALLTGLGVEIPGAPVPALKLFNVAPPAPPPLAQAERSASTNKDLEGAAAPPNLKARPTEIVAPEPEVRLDVPQLIVAAPIAGLGLEASAGAAPLPGPGTGAGGEGNGLGNGRGGSGTGGGGGGIAVRARHISGSIEVSDFPRSARRERNGRVVDVQFTIGTDGRARSCSTYKSSGNLELDAATCRLIEERFRFEPARDAQGRPVPERSGWEQHWWLERSR